MEQVTRRQLLHDIRGRLNGLQLCVAALESSPTRGERLEFLDDILVVAEKLDRLMATLNDMIDRHPEEYCPAGEGAVSSNR